MNLWWNLIWVAGDSKYVITSLVQEQLRYVANNFITDANMLSMLRNMLIVEIWVEQIVPHRLDIEMVLGIHKRI